MTGMKSYGHDRVVFRAHLPLIRAELDAGHTMQAVFNRLRDKLGTMSYRQFARYVGREITEPAAHRQTVSRSLSVLRKTPPAAPPSPKPSAATNPPQGTNYAGHEPKPSAAYVPHDGNPKEDDLARLITGKRA